MVFGIKTSFPSYNINALKGLIVIFSDVAMKAVEAGLNEMAELLLEKETRLNRQVEMLLKLNKVDKALAKAAKSQQPDLCRQFIIY